MTDVSRGFRRCYPGSMHHNSPTHPRLQLCSGFLACFWAVGMLSVIVVHCTILGCTVRAHLTPIQEGQDFLVQLPQLRTHVMLHAHTASPTRLPHTFPHLCSYREGQQRAALRGGLPHQGG